MEIVLHLKPTELTKFFGYEDNFLNRCAWVKDYPHEIAYHDDEWGVPVTDDRKLFEFLIADNALAEVLKDIYGE